jgi:hypothetical protein
MISGSAPNVFLKCSTVALTTGPVSERERARERAAERSEKECEGERERKRLASGTAP